MPPLNTIDTKFIEANFSVKRYVIHQGGTGAGKTYSILQHLLTTAFLKDGLAISVVAESMPHLKRGCLRDARKIIQMEGWQTNFTENKTDCTFSAYNGSYIEFFPADSESKMRGPKRDILFINECNNVSFEAFQQLDVRTRKHTYLDFNPVRRFWVHDKLMESLSGTDYTFVQSTYKDNAYITPEEIANIERRRNNANWWRVYGEGEIGNAEGVVFTNWEIITIKNEELRIKNGNSPNTLNSSLLTLNWLPGTLLGYGIDFGYVHSPTAIVQVNEYNGELYVRELFYKTGAQNDEIFAFVQKNIDLRALAVADCAEPKSIDYLFRKGWPGLFPSIKGEGSIEFGLNMLLERKINVSRDSLNLIKEMREYMWDTNADGVPINRPVKMNDHAIDAMRYVCSYPPKKKLIMA
ncbi:MAG: PBSX family phage terminase large subunit [Bacteroidia bacterium]